MSDECWSIVYISLTAKSTVPDNGGSFAIAGVLIALRCSVLRLSLKVVSEI